MRKSIKDYSITELSDLQYAIENLPLEMKGTLNIDGKEVDIEEYIENYTEEFFDVPDSMFEEIVGKTYVNKDNDLVFKVVGYNPNHPAEFYYEQYSKDRSGWEPKDYIWLEDGDNEWFKQYYTEPGALEAFEKWEKDPNVDMNVAAEEMYMLGKDGNMYVDYSCGGDYEVYTPIDDNGATFELIKNSIKKNN